MKTKTMISQIAVIGVAGAFGWGFAQAADPARINWSKIPVTTIPLFYPAQSSYEWLISAAHEGAGNRVKNGAACSSCHDEKDAERELGEKLVKAGPLEPMPVKGKEGYKDLKVQAAFDEKNAYLRFQWKTQEAYPGTEHQYLRF